MGGNLWSKSALLPLTFLIVGFVSSITHQLFNCSKLITFWCYLLPHIHMFFCQVWRDLPFIVANSIECKLQCLTGSPWTPAVHRKLQDKWALAHRALHTGIKWQKSSPLYGNRCQYVYCYSDWFSWIGDLLITLSPVNHGCGTVFSGIFENKQKKSSDTQLFIFTKRQTRIMPQLPYWKLCSLFRLYVLMHPIFIMGDFNCLMTTAWIISSSTLLAQLEGIKLDHCYGTNRGAEDYTRTDGLLWMYWLGWSHRNSLYLYRLVWKKKVRHMRLGIVHCHSPWRLQTLSCLSHVFSVNLLSSVKCASRGPVNSGVLLRKPVEL